MSPFFGNLLGVDTGKFLKYVKLTFSFFRKIYLLVGLIELLLKLPEALEIAVAFKQNRF